VVWRPAARSVGSELQRSVAATRAPRTPAPPHTSHHKHRATTPFPPHASSPHANVDTSETKSMRRLTASRAPARQASVAVCRSAAATTSSTTRDQVALQQPHQASSGSGSSSSGGLAEYSMLRRSTSPSLQQSSVSSSTARAAWLEPAVQEAVRYIGVHSCTSSTSAEPFLLLVNPRAGVRFETVPLSQPVVAGGWAAVATQVGSAAAEAVLLIQPVPEGEQPTSSCVASNLGPSSSSQGSSAESGECSECAAAAAAAAAARGADACGEYSVPGSSQTTITSGRVGDCCDGEEQHHSSSAAAARASPSAPSAACAAHAQGQPHYYGVVVMQSPEGGGGGGGPEGCYLLKTTHMAQPALGCACSQYALTRVAKGPPLTEQLMQSWLV